MTKEVSERASFNMESHHSYTRSQMTDLGIACIACLSTGALSAGVFLLKLSPHAATAAVVGIAL